MEIELADIKDKLRRLTVSKSTVEFLGDQDLGRRAYGRLFKVWYHGSMCTAKEINIILIKAAYTSAERRRLHDNFICECTTAATSTIPTL